MGHVLFRRRQWRAVLVLPIAAFALSVATDNAGAAAWIANTGATTCSGGPLTVGTQTFYNQQGQCTFTNWGTAAFRGQFDTTVPAPMPSDCLPQALDQTDTVCGHFSTNPSNVRGTMSYKLNFDTANLIRLCVVRIVTDPVTGMDTPVAINDVFGQEACTTLSGATITINVACTDTHFEALILPVSFQSQELFLVPPVLYDGNVSGNLRSCLPGDTGDKADNHRDEFDHHGDGGGHGENDDTHEGENVSSNVDERDSDHQRRGEVRYTKKGCDMRSTQIDSVSWNDATRTMIVTGYGTVNGLGSVPFVFTMTDNGPGTSDTYNVQSTCSGHGHLQKGDFKYKHS